MSNSPKPFKTYEEQIEILKSRNLQFEDEATAKQFLEIHNYYNVINGYKTPFLKPGEENFLPETSFEYIKVLYLFDISLRHSVLSVLLDIETTLKSIISYEFARLHGELSYLDTDAYKYSDERSIRMTDEHIRHIETMMEYWNTHLNVSYQNIKHYMSEHGCVPIWVVCSHLNMSDMSKMYACLKPETQQAVCDHLVAIYKHPFNTNFLYNSLRILSDVRNLCAHNQRLYNYECSHKLKSRNNTFIKENILANFGVNYKYDNIMSILIAIYHLTDSEQLFSCLSGFAQQALDLQRMPSQFTTRLATKNSAVFDFIYTIADIINRNS